MTLSSPMKFSPGRIIIAPAALSRLSADDIRQALNRHLNGDWGDLAKVDREENQHSLATGHRLLSVYHSHDGIQFWIITEADRSMTNIYLPESHHRRDLGHDLTEPVNGLKKASRSAPKPTVVHQGLTFRFRMQ